MGYYPSLGGAGTYFWNTPTALNIKTKGCQVILEANEKS